MMERLVEVPPDDGGPLNINELTLENAWTGVQGTGTNNPNILYIAVEYVKENEMRLEADTTMIPQQTYSEFDQHVSPLDPNMSSVARYSPVYAAETSAAYENSVVITQLVASDDGNVAEANMNANTDLNHQVVNNGYLQMVNETADVRNRDSLRLVPSETEQEVELLIMDQNTGISYNVNTQEYLEDRCLADDQQLLANLAQESLLGADLLTLDVGVLKSQLSEIIIEPSIVNVPEFNRIVESTRPKRIIKTELIGHSEEDLLSCVQAITDKPILTRAKATLPESYLSIQQIGNSEGIFARKFIPKKTQFGPLEGIISLETMKVEDTFVLSIEDENGLFQRLDISNEDNSNWMAFVRKATNYDEQNCVVIQNENGLYYTTIRNIYPKQELMVGYGMLYAKSRKLSIFEPQIKTEDYWPCFECSETFINSAQLQRHLDEHDEEAVGVIWAPPPPTEMTDCVEQQADKKPRKQIMQPSLPIMDPPLVVNENITVNGNGSVLQCTLCSMVFRELNRELLWKHLATQHSVETQGKLAHWFIQKDEPETVVVMKASHNLEMNSTNSSKMAPEKKPYRCPSCVKSFGSADRLQRHLMVHGSEESKPMQCEKCKKRFLNKSALACHIKTHQNGRKIFECPICKQGYLHVLELRAHVIEHAVDGSYPCPHCSKIFPKYCIIRKHIRAFHCERRHNCNTCSKCFPTLDKLRLHLLKHSDHKEFLCADCGKQFKRKDKLMEHCKRMHSEERENAAPKEGSGSGGGDDDVCKKFTPKVQPTDYQRFVYKCHTCLVGFKRRGMLVNHLAKRHPDVSPDSVPELNLPILRATRDYYCQYCEKVYKSSSKRKAHILKNHPGAALPQSNRKQDAKLDLPNPTYSQTVGSVTTHPQSCQWCHKQYASKAKLLQHQRKEHKDDLRHHHRVHGLSGDEDGGKLSEDDHHHENNNSGNDHGQPDAEDEFLTDVVQQGDGHYYHLVPIAGDTGGGHYVEQKMDVGDQEVRGGDGQGEEEDSCRLYKLLTTGNNLVPPR